MIKLKIDIKQINKNEINLTERQANWIVAVQNNKAERERVLNLHHKCFCQDTKHNYENMLLKLEEERQELMMWEGE